MKTIELTRGKEAMVDDADFDWLNKLWWHATTDNTNWYATSYTKGKMHRLIMGISDVKIKIDHVDGNGLNNQRSNLRLCTQAENTRNRTKHKGKYLGVHNFNCTNKYGKTYSYFRTELKINGKRHTKIFKTEVAAAQHYNALVLEHNNGFGTLNVIL